MISETFFILHLIQGVTSFLFFGLFDLELCRLLACSVAEAYEMPLFGEISVFKASFVWLMVLG